jgi:hypothetical protein
LYADQGKHLLEMLQIRASIISNSIQEAVIHDGQAPKTRANPVKRRLVRIPFKILLRLASFFSIFSLPLARYRAADFLTLRQDYWQLDEDEYVDSFEPPSTPAISHSGKDADRHLQPIGDLGYSGSTFFTTANSKFLIKSLPRRFEHEFFTQELFNPYAVHMKRLPHSLLVRITDMVFTPYATLGGILGTAPTHHIIMENLLHGRAQGSVEAATSSNWETYDLKPNSYFFPERDLADGKLTPESVKDKLIDEFPDKVRVDAQQRRELLELLDADTTLLAENNAVDYSLFLVRYPGPRGTGAPQNVPLLKCDAHPWRTGVVDVNGEWVYRVMVLDFFWAKHKLHPKILTNLVKLFNKVAHKGPMSITAEPFEYKKRFLSMVREIVKDE